MITAFSFDVAVPFGAAVVALVFEALVFEALVFEALVLEASVFEALGPAN